MLPTLLWSEGEISVGQSDMCQIADLSKKERFCDYELGPLAVPALTPLFSPNSVSPGCACCYSYLIYSQDARQLQSRCSRIDAVSFDGHGICHSCEGGSNVSLRRFTTLTHVKQLHISNVAGDVAGRILFAVLQALQTLCTYVEGSRRCGWTSARLVRFPLCPCGLHRPGRLVRAAQYQCLPVHRTFPQRRLGRIV